MADNPIPTLRASKLTVSPNSSIPEMEVVSLLSSFLNPEIISSSPINIRIIEEITFISSGMFFIIKLPK